MKHAVVIAAALVFGASAATAAGPFDGTWKLDPTTVAAGTKPFDFALVDGTYSCTTCDFPYSVKADGAFHPVAGNPYRDEVAIKVDSPSALTLTARKAGRTTLIETMTVSPDRATITYDFTDTSAPTGVPVVGKQVGRRVAPGPKGSHATSGSWLDTDYSANDAGSTFMMATSGDALTFSTPTGQSYTATIGGPRAAVAGDPGWDGVTLVRGAPDTLVETDFSGDVKTGVSTYVVAADGRTLRVSSNDLRNGATYAWTMIKR